MRIKTYSRLRLVFVICDLSHKAVAGAYDLAEGHCLQGKRITSLKFFGKRTRNEARKTLHKHGYLEGNTTCEKTTKKHVNPRP